MRADSGLCIGMVASAAVFHILLADLAQPGDKECTILYQIKQQPRREFRELIILCVYDVMIVQPVQSLVI